MRAKKAHTINFIIVLAVSFLMLFGHTEIAYSKNFKVKAGKLPPSTEFTEKPAHKPLEKTATLSVEAVRTALPDENNIKLSVVVDPGGQSINAVLVTLRYSKDVLGPPTIDTSDSRFSIFLEEDINKKEGTMTIICLQPFPGIDEKANIVNINFRPLKAGIAEIEILNSSMVLANDGYGTNLFKNNE